MDALDRLAAAVARLPDVRGRGWLAHRLFRRFRTRFEDGEWTITMRRGHQMVVPRSTLQGWEAAFTGAYDDREFDLVRPYIAPGSTVVDVGASVGFWTVALARWTPAGRVLAVEPIAANVEVLERNVARNHVDDRVSVVVCALGGGDGLARVSVERGGVGNAHVVFADEAGRLPLQGLDEVEVRTLDSCDVDGPCSFVKLDVEGYELEVLAGGDDFVSRYRPVILGEFNRWLMKRRAVDADAPLAWARERDYKVLEVVRTPARRTNPFAPRPLELVPVTTRRDRGPWELLLLPR